MKKCATPGVSIRLFFGPWPPHPPDGPTPRSRTVGSARRPCVVSAASRHANYATPQKPLFSMRREEPSKNDLDPRVKQKEYVDSKRRVLAERLCYARPTRSFWPLKQGAMGDLPQLKEDLEQKMCVDGNPAT